MALDMAIANALRARAAVKTPGALPLTRQDEGYGSNAVRYAGPITPTTASPQDTMLPGPTGRSPIPGIDPFLQASATTAYQNALNQVNQGRTSKLGQYGFKADSFDDQGNPVGLGVDPNSMFGSYQQLLRSQAGDAAAAEDNAAGRGLVGSGLGKANEGNLRYDWGAQNLDLGRGLTGDLGALSARALSAKDAYNTTIYQGTMDAINQAIANGDYTAVDDPSYTPTTPWSDNSTTPPDATTVSRPSVKGKTVLWNNQYMNAQKLANTLVKSGSSVRTFVQTHPAAAKAIGLTLPKPPAPKRKGGGV